MLHGNEALAAVGMGVAPPPPQKAEEIKTYSDFMAAHYGEEYEERDIKNVVDRFCINNPKQERGFLVCPGDFLIDTVKGVGGRAAGALIPILYAGAS